MKRSYRHNEGEAYLAQYPRLRRWIHQCVACQRVGYRSDLPEQIGISVAAQNIRRYFEQLDLDDRGFCEECGSNPVLKLPDEFGPQKKA